MRRLPLLPLLLIAGAGVNFFLRSFVGLSLGDEGYILSLSLRVLEGERPYLDFFTLYPPTIYGILAALLHFFGPSVLWSRFLTALVKTAICFLCYRLARQSVPPSWALLSVVFVFFLEVTDEGTLIPYAALFAELLILAAWLALARFHREPRPRFLFAAGLLCAAAFSFKQPPGAAAAIAFAYWIFILNPKALRRRGREFSLKTFRLLASACALLLLSLPFLITVEPAGFLFVLPFVLVVLAVMQAKAPALPAAIPPLSTRVAAFFGGWLAVFVPWLVAMCLYLGPATAAGGIFLHPNLEISQRFSLSLLVQFTMGALRILGPMLGSFLLALFFVWRRAGAKASQPEGTDQLQLRLGVLLVGALFFTLYPWPSSTRALWIVGPSMVVLVWALFRIGQLLPDKCWLGIAPRWRGSFVFLLAFALLAGDVLAAPWSWSLRAREYLKANFLLLAARDRLTFLGLERAPVWVSPRDMQARSVAAVARRIETLTPQDTAILAFPRGAIFYFLTGRANRLHYAELSVTRLDSKDQQKIILELLKQDIRLVVWSDLQEDPGRQFPWIHSFLGRFSEEIETIGDFRISRLRRPEDFFAVSDRPAQ
ncbi:MAG: glycosyltransferase family 39 protein [Acidobacteria bacterium]|nr:glycosyltransferase family 39 protein [Acidobacteriota bacterium]